jgi:hypothetical protein
MTGASQYSSANLQQNSLRVGVPVSDVAPEEQQQQQAVAAAAAAVAAAVASSSAAQRSSY